MWVCLDRSGGAAGAAGQSGTAASASDDATAQSNGTTWVDSWLFQDERLPSLDQLPKYSSHSVVLSKMLKEQLLKKEELQLFQSSLLPHQKAVCYMYIYMYVQYASYVCMYVTAQITSDGYTIPEKAVMEHNMLSLSRIYENIYFSDLAAILHIDSTRAEKVT